MLNKLLKGSLVLLLAISLAACGGKKETPDSNNNQGGDDQTIDINIDLASVMKDYEKIEPGPKYTGEYNWFEIGATVPGFGILKDTKMSDITNWNAGYNINFPADISKIKHIFYGTDETMLDLVPGFFGKVVFDQDGKQISPVSNRNEYTNSFYLFKSGKHAAGLYPEERLTFKKVTKLIAVLIFNNDKAKNKKGQYIVWPPINIRYK